MTPLQSLVGCTGRRWVMGVISQLEDGHFFLEDLSASVPVDLSQAISWQGFWVSLCFPKEAELRSTLSFSLTHCGSNTSSEEAVGFLGFRIYTQHDFLDSPLTCKHKITTGFFTENSVIVAEGDFQANGVFQVLLLLELQCIFSTFSVQAPHCHAWSIPTILC
jgi:DNA polymerase epsilon subunit 2